MMKSKKQQLHKMSFKASTNCLNNFLKLSPLLLMLSSPLAYSKLTVTRIPATPPATVLASDMTRVAPQEVQTINTTAIGENTESTVTQTNVSSDNGLMYYVLTGNTPTTDVKFADKDLPFITYTSTPIIPTPSTTSTPTSNMQDVTQLADLPVDSQIIEPKISSPKISFSTTSPNLLPPIEGMSMQTLQIDEVKRVVPLKQPKLIHETEIVEMVDMDGTDMSNLADMDDIEASMLEMPMPVNTPTTATVVSTPNSLSDNIPQKSTPQELSIKPETVAPVPLLITDKSPRQSQSTPLSIDDIVIANPNRDLPSSLDKNIHMPTITISLKDLLAIIESYSPVDMTLAREVDATTTNRIRSVKRVPLKRLLNNALKSDELTYKSIGQDLLFIYKDNAYSNCVYNRINSDKLDASNNTSPNTQAVASIEDYSYNYSLDDPSKASIRMDDQSIDSTLDFITSFTNQQVYYDSGLLFPYGGTTPSSMPDTTDSINLRSKNLNQVLTILSYRNGMDYQFVGDDILLITENPNLEACKGFLEQSVD